MVDRARAEFKSVYARDKPGEDTTRQYGSWWRRENPSWPVGSILIMQGENLQEKYIVAGICAE